MRIMLSLATYHPACKSHVVKQSLWCHERTYNELGASIAYPISQLVKCQIVKKIVTVNSLWRTSSWWVFRKVERATVIVLYNP